MSLIKCDQVSLSYGSHRALDCLSFTVESGGPVALVGPNGAGKTSLFSCLCGYQRPDSGSISVLGHAPGSAALAGRLAALPQDAKLDARFSIKAQLTYFARLQGMSAKQAQTEAMRVLALVDLEGIADKQPSELSHGMNKRVSIAQALLGNPELVLLDEPTAGLDPANTKAIRELIKSLKDQTQFMISSHNLDELEKLCSSVLYIDKGQLTKSMAVESADAGVSYLTLKMMNADDQTLLPALERLTGVSKVEQTAAGEFVLQTQPRQGHQLESEVLQLLSAHGWQYRMLLNGRTLEDSLFSASS
ncbi:ABC transporter ATP-binding protein [Shewanella corallii]|uniref:ABC transporter ATP-binding protein n=1 Tax=Shewanella corallii TaxID=560080 RepID=A0ABT0N8F9_9GAMM|nr:ABC transporter ATP-binding protein [Shewanella corallii]